MGPMALKAAIWIHRTGVGVEGSVEQVTRRGDGAVSRDGATTWFHLPVTTPVILDGKLLRLVTDAVEDAMTRRAAFDILTPAERT
jgi:hypothetical protein